MRREFSIYKRADKKCYYYTTYINGKRVFRSTGEKTKAEALNYCLRLRDSGALHQQEIKGIYFRDFAKDFFAPDGEYVKSKRVGNRSFREPIRRNREIMLNKRIMPYFADYLLTEITPQLIRSWMLSIKGVCADTINNYLKTLNAILTEAMFKDLIKYNPCQRVKRFATEKKEKRTFTTEEIRKLFNVQWKNNDIKMMCKLSCLTGMRIGEVKALTKENVKDDYIIVNSSMEHLTKKVKETKSKKERIVPISREFARELKELAKNNKVFVFSKRDETTITKHLKKQLKLIGIEDANLTFHSFRHYFNSQLVLSDVKSEIIRKVIGHESEGMTERYLHILPSELDKIRKVQQNIF